MVNNKTYIRHSEGIIFIKFVFFPVYEKDNNNYGLVVDVGRFTFYGPMESNLFE